MSCNPYQSPEEVIQAELVVEHEYPDAGWRHILAGPAIIGSIMFAWWLIYGDGLAVLAVAIEWTGLSAQAGR